MTNYDNLLDGAKGLLGDCVKLLSTTKQDYVIVGGWSPLLLNSSIIRHPGTHDVDLLFREGKSERELKDVFNLFLNNGYLTSAKHNFQLLKVIRVAGQDFVYNVDFLHSSDNQRREDMFVDHLKLPVPLNEYKDSTYIEMSIKAPNSDVLFQEKLFEHIKQDFVLPDGSKASIAFPLINEAGLIITKTDSVKQAKRKRDAFDIYLATKHARNYNELISVFRRLKTTNAYLFNSLYGIREALEKHDMIFNILDYVYDDQEKKYEHREAVTNEVKKFLEDAGLEKLAKNNYEIPE